jgi:uncharacterized protein Smg (DUF494 family)
MMQWTAREAWAYLREVRPRDDESETVRESTVSGRGGVVRRLDESGASPPQATEAVCTKTWCSKATDAGRWCAEPAPESRRVYTPWEERFLGSDGRALLDELCSLDALDAVHRELVIERVLALGCPELSVEDLCWAVLHALNVVSEHEVPVGFLLFTESDYRH